MGLYGVCVTYLNVRLGPGKFQSRLSVERKIEIERNELGG